MDIDEELDRLEVNLAPKLSTVEAKEGIMVLKLAITKRLPRSPDGAGTEG